MQPLIRDDDTLLIRPVDEKRIRTGDVVLCSNFLDHALVHRVIAKAVYKNEIHFLVKGDQASKPDGWLPGSRIVGKVSEINRAGSVIAMDQPSMKFLGLLAAIRSRWNFGHLRFVQFIWKYVKELPIFYKYIH